MQPLHVEDVLGIVLPETLPITYFILPSGKQILNQEWEGVFTIPEDLVLTNWTSERYKVRPGPDETWVFSSRELIYRRSVVYDEDYEETWKLGDPYRAYQRMSSSVNSVSVLDSIGNTYITIYRYVVYTASGGECDPGESQLIIDIEAQHFHSECNSSPALDMSPFVLDQGTYEWPCSTTPKDPGPVSCNASALGVATDPFSGFNNYSNWNGVNIHEDTELGVIRGITFTSEVTPGGGITIPALITLGGTGVLDQLGIPELGEVSEWIKKH